MKGIIFTEFLDIVESAFGMEVCQQMLDEAFDEGSYTAVGSYDHKDLVKLIITLSKITSVPAEDLQEVYGKAVFTRLLESLPIPVDGQTSTFTFIKKVEEHIHIEVKKLYPDATPPRFEFISETESQMVMDYRSARCMSHVCLGLIKGCAEHFNQTIEVEMEPIVNDQSHVRFNILLAA
ncbi:guanylate cyclase [Photobacterium jeanii]|uniref:Guanylate cyclase n=1 Tax=Photobacterium jeanii TaxID=858640 RepID=A0A178K278_9GAMM|nr:heme NO-binding domain-containing protein [Photobacterium jeanii]OAN11410.1 guanylate cyclase [Photobacterium jeanii]PST90930.1 guanylate cyclase [Photobacterium jeanii]